MDSDSCSSSVIEIPSTDRQEKRLSRRDFQLLKNLVACTKKKLEDVLAEFKETGSHASYNLNGELELDGFRAFVSSYLEADVPERLVKQLFLSFVKKLSYFELYQEKAEKPSVETALKIESPQEDPEADDSTFVAPMSPVPPCGMSVGELAEVFQSLKYIDSSDEASDAEDTCKEACRALTPSFKPLSFHGSDEDIPMQMITMPVEVTLHFVDEEPRGATAVPTSEEKEESEPGVLNCPRVEETSLIKAEAVGPVTQLVAIKDIACFFSLMESGTPQDKIEFFFRVYDTEGKGVLKKSEIQSIMLQVINVAEYLNWEPSELTAVMRDVMLDIDYGADDTVSLEEWIKGSSTILPLLVLIGLDCSASGSGNHCWRSNTKPAYCNLCLNLLIGFGRNGLCCVFCRLIVHERCLQRNPISCVTTYSKTKSSKRSMTHHWVEGNCSGDCFLCDKSVTSYTGIGGLRCRWCQIVLHNSCAREVSPLCSIGPNRLHIVPPTVIYPALLDRRRGTAEEGEMAVNPCQPTFFRIKSVPGTKPLLVFINPKSGGRQGAEVKREFQYSLNPRQVYDLIQDDPIQALQLFKDVENLRVICCGGDGTVGWILDMIDKSDFAIHPTIGVVPLGTGNDLARCLQWGGGYDGELISDLLQKIEVASVVVLDRWNIEIIDDTVTDTKPGSVNKTNSVMTNYFSVGVDAAICRKFHKEREKCPEKFNSRIKNKLLYFEFATYETFSASCRNLHQDVELKCDGVPLDLANGQPLQGIAILNIPSTHGGTNLWGDVSDPGGFRDECRMRLDILRGGGENESAQSLPKIKLDQTLQDFGDGLIEVVGLESCLHMGQVRTGLRASGRRLAQCSTLTMKTKKQLPMQIDGEPWMQNPSTINIYHRRQVPMLRPPIAEERGQTCCLL